MFFCVSAAFISLSLSYSQTVTVMFLDTMLTLCLSNSWKTGASFSLNSLRSLLALIKARPSTNVQEVHSSMHTNVPLISQDIKTPQKTTQIFYTKTWKCFMFGSRCFDHKLILVMHNKTHGKGCVASWQRGWSHCQGCECERRSWQHSEKSGWWLLVLWRNSSLCSARRGVKDGPDCWGTSLPSKPSHQISWRGTYDME